jgi:hypothetical protein
METVCVLCELGPEFLGVLYEVKKNALSADDASPSICDVLVVLATKRVVGFSGNSVYEICTKGCRACLSFVKIAPVTGVHKGAN